VEPPHNVRLQFLKLRWNKFFQHINVNICGHRLSTKKKCPVVYVTHGELIWWGFTEKLPLLSEISLRIHGVFLVVTPSIRSLSSRIDRLGPERESFGR
jgi:hypothetical protein